MTDEPKIKRSLGHIGGRVRARGDATLLKAAWERASAEDGDVLTHGFHSWPARMHWAIARTILEGMRPRSMVDPFCGGGTTLVEARVAGVRAVGVDLNPLARRVAEVRLDARPHAERKAFVALAADVAARSEARVRGRVPIRVDLPNSELQWWSPHVLKELGGLREEIARVERFEDRRALAMVFSSILTKVSRQRSDTSEQPHERRIRKGLATELFLRKAEELGERWKRFAATAKKAPPTKLIEGDALRLPRLVGTRRFDLVLTSPPYGGTYDYAAHHARRLAWLELDDRALRRQEMGSRRRGSRADAVEVWERQVDDMLRAMRAVLSPTGRIVLVTGDATMARQRVKADEQLERLAPRHGLEVAGVASQPREDRRGRGPREEHIVLLRISS